MTVNARYAAFFLFSFVLMISSVAAQPNNSQSNTDFSQQIDTQLNNATHVAHVKWGGADKNKTEFVIYSEVPNRISISDAYSIIEAENGDTVNVKSDIRLNAGVTRVKMSLTSRGGDKKVIISGAGQPRVVTPDSKPFLQSINVFHLMFSGFVGVITAFGVVLVYFRSKNKKVEESSGILI